MTLYVQIDPMFRKIGDHPFRKPLIFSEPGRKGTDSARLFLAACRSQLNKQYFFVFLKFQVNGCIKDNN